MLERVAWNDCRLVFSASDSIVILAESHLDLALGLIHRYAFLDVKSRKVVSLGFFVRFLLVNLCRFGKAHPFLVLLLLDSRVRSFDFQRHVLINFRGYKSWLGRIGGI